MRLLFKLLRKLVFLALLLLMAGYAAKYGWRFAMKVAGVPQVSTEESDLMSTVFSSAVRLVTGSAKKDDLARELSDKLYAGRGSPEEMKELGIEIVRPGASPSTTQGAAPSPAGVAATPGKSAAPPPGAKPTLDDLRKKLPVTLLGKIWDRLRQDSVGMTLAPALFAGMVVTGRLRRKSSKMEDLLPSILAMQNQADSDPSEMTHGVHALGSEDFELLIALIYQRQGYRVSMSAGQSGGRGGDFTLSRKAEKLLVQCKKLACEHRIAVERVREFHEAMVTAGFTRGLFVASCGYSWDARHFAKTKGITLINARTLDQLLTAARETPDENLLAVAGWAPKLVQKITLTAALCPACDAPMDEIVASGQPVWLCSQRPDCRGRRNARKRWKPATRPAGPPMQKATGEVPTVAGAGAVPEAKPAPTKPTPPKPVSSRRLDFRRLASTVRAAKPAVQETAPPSPPEEPQYRPANLKSVLPRQRPAQESSPAGAGFPGVTNPPVTRSPADGRKAADAALRRRTTDGVRPGTPA